MRKAALALFTLALPMEVTIESAKLALLEWQVGKNAGWIRGLELS